MKFSDLLKRGIQFSLAVRLQYEQLKGNTDFWVSLDFDQWLDLYFSDGIPPELKDRAANEVKKLASTFSNMERIVVWCSKEDPLKEWARQQMTEKASTFKNYSEVFRRVGKYDFAKLLELADGFDDLCVFCNLVASNVREPGERNRLIGVAVGKMSALKDVECRKWIGAYALTLTDEVRQLARAKIQGFDFPTATWLYFYGLYPGAKNLPHLAAEKALASAHSFNDCKAIYERLYNTEVFEKMLPLAKTIEELDWLASRNSHKQPLAGQIVDRMARLSKTFDDWKRVYFYSRPDNPRHAEAFARMKELATV